MKLLILAVIFAFFAALPAAGAENDVDKTMPEDMTIKEAALRKLHHTKDGRFTNPWYLKNIASFKDLLKWRFSDNPYAQEKKKPVHFPVSMPDFTALEETNEDYAVWLGHSTVLIKAAGVRIITDPVFGDINFFIKRKTPFPIDTSKIATELPGIDFVLISHGHYDHLNTDSIKLLKEAFDPTFIAGPGYKDYFDSINIKKYAPLDWWESKEHGRIKITSLPVQHWSKRSPFDDNKMLWCSFLIATPDKKYYWVGDSGYYKGFSEIGKEFGPIDTAFLPVGSYEPRWIMKSNHFNPEEAIAAAHDLRAKTVVPIHWGTFDLTDEPLTMPIEHLKELHPSGGNPRFIILRHGGSTAIGK